LTILSRCRWLRIIGWLAQYRRWFAKFYGCFAHVRESYFARIMCFPLNSTESGELESWVQLSWLELASLITTLHLPAFSQPLDDIILCVNEALFNVVPPPKWPVLCRVGR